jgi:hypothetical protein
LLLLDASVGSRPSRDSFGQRQVVPPNRERPTSRGPAGAARFRVARMQQPHPAPPLVVRSGSEVAAAPSLCSSQGSGSRPSARCDYRRLCDPHNPGSDIDRDRGAVGAVPGDPTAIWERTRWGDSRRPSRGDKYVAHEERFDTCLSCSRSVMASTFRSMSCVRRRSPISLSGLDGCPPRVLTTIYALVPFGSS